MKRFYFILALLLAGLFQVLDAQTTSWYDAAQSRIDTLRKGPFSIRLLSATGIPVKDSVRVNLKNHAFPWGTAYDLSYVTTSPGTTYSGSTSNAITSTHGDNEIYKTERWGTYLAYQLSAVSGKTYFLTLKLAELYFSKAGSRVFDVYVDGKRVMKGIDKYALAKGKYIALDTTVQMVASRNYFKIEFLATQDNVSVNGLVLQEASGSSVLRLNCGGSTMAVNGKTYFSDASYINNTSASLIPTTDDWYKAIMLKYCHYGVCGNQFKWSGIEPTKGVLNYAPFENTLHWFQKNDWDMRAHTLLWGGTSNTDYHCIPQWVMNLSSTPKVMYDTCKMRVMREVTRYKGVVKEYDVLNEPTHANHLQSVVGDSINWNCFKWAHEADPDARLFVNDYNIIEWQDQTDNFVQLVKTMLNNGAPVTGIGAQCHIGSSVDIDNFKARFDQLAQFGLPIKITEFDMAAKSLTQQQYAVEMAKMMRLAFSHPAIEGFIFWGLTEPTWVPASIVNLVREDQTTKIAADSVYDLIHHVWSTDINALTDENGGFAFNGYYGDYEVSVKNGNQWECFDLTCGKAEKGQQFTLTLGEGEALRPKLTDVQVVSSNCLQLTFDKKMENPSGNVSNFKIFGSKMNYFLSASLKLGDSTSILLTTNAPVSAKDYIPVSYAPGTVKAADGAALEAFGPVLNASLTPSYLSSETSTNGKSVRVYFDRNLSDTTVCAADFSVQVNNRTDSVLEAKLGSTGYYVELVLEKAVLDTSDMVTVGYTGGSLKTTDEKSVTSFDLAECQNNLVLPKFVSAITSINGLYLTLTFDQVMSDPSGQESYFMVTASSGSNLLVAAASLLSYDKTKIKLTLSSPIFKGDTVTLSYKPGSLCASSGAFFKAFASTVSNISYTSLGEVSNARVAPYPNPFKDVLAVENTGANNEVSILNVSGKVEFQEPVEPFSRVEIRTSMLEVGHYLLILSDGAHMQVYKIQKN
jgi:uncharacterized repeat protein (TIGR02059 family)